MCGIVGVMSSEGTKDWLSRKKFMNQAIFADTVRGYDSTGLFMASAGKILKPDTAYYKRALSGPDFLEISKVQTMLTYIDDYTFTVGHNRAATKGGVTDMTSHPFDFEHIIGVHNGTLDNHYNLPGGNKFGVDSEALFNAMNNEGAKEILEHVSGAFALVWYDKRDGRLYMVRNEDRPLSFATVKNQDTILLASEAGMLNWLGARNGLTLDKILHLKPGNLISFDPENVQDFESETVTLKKKRVYTGYNNHWDNQYDRAPANTSKRGETGAALENRVLGSIGKKKDDDLLFVSSGFSLYNQFAKVGTINGYEEEAYASVISYNVDSLIHKWSDYDGKYLVGKIGGVSVDKDNVEQIRVTQVRPATDDEIQAELDAIDERKLEEDKKKEVAAKQKQEDELKKKKLH